MVHAEQPNLGLAIDGQICPILNQQEMCKFSNVWLARGPPVKCPNVELAKYVLVKLPNAGPSRDVYSSLMLSRHGTCEALHAGPAGNL